MKKEKNKGKGGLVYSTDPDTMSSLFKDIHRDEKEIEPEEQELRVWTDSKSRSGKVVTLVTGFRGPETALKDLTRFLKVKCGVGGSIKDGAILIQGDHRDKIIDLLKAAGYKKIKKAGG